MSSAVSSFTHFCVKRNSYHVTRAPLRWSLFFTRVWCVVCCLFVCVVGVSVCLRVVVVFFLCRYKKSEMSVNVNPWKTQLAKGNVSDTKKQTHSLQHTQHNAAHPPDTSPPFSHVAPTHCVCLCVCVCVCMCVRVCVCVCVCVW